MRRSYLSALLFAAGMCLAIAGAGLGPGRTPQASAQPRPTLTPVPTNTAVQPPTRNHHAQGPSAATGRITGTVIDLTTGAPVPGIPVMVGDTTITSDANGNYDRTGLPLGSYSVALVLTETQGTPAQEPIQITLAADAVVVQHLFFRSQPAASPTPVATGTAQPVQLPRTGGPATIGWLWMVLGIGAVALGGVLKAVDKRKRIR